MENVNPLWKGGPENSKCIVSLRCDIVHAVIALQACETDLVRCDRDLRRPRGQQPRDARRVARRRGPVQSRLPVFVLRPHRGPA